MSELNTTDVLNNSREKRRKSYYRSILGEIVELMRDIDGYYESNPYLTFVPNDGFQKQFLNSTKRFRVIFAGNRSGKSILSSYEVCRFAMGNVPTKKVEVPNVGWVVCPDSRLFVSVILPYLKKFLGQNLKKYFKREQIILCNNGSEIHFKSVDSGVEKFTGASIRYCAIDEDCPEEIFREIVMRTIDQQGDLWITITPLYSTWMYEKIYLRQYTDPELEVFVGTTYENLKHISQEEIERLKTIYPQEELQARLYGKFLFLSGLVYSEFNKSKHLIAPFHIPDDWVRVRIIDHGIQDPTCCLWVAINSKNEYYVYREYYETGKTIAENVKNIIALTGKEYIYRSYIDPTTDKRNPQSNITDYKAYIQAGLSPLSKAPLVEIGTKINMVKTRLREGKLFIFSNLINTIREFSTYCYKKNGMPEDKNNHAMDCIGYLCVLNLKYEVLKGFVPQFLPKSNTFNKREDIW